MKRVIVVGSGIAGLVAALELRKHFAVTLVTKAGLAESNTRWAQGGIAAAMSAEDSVQEHVEDTLNAGAGLCDRRAVEVLCAEGPQRIRGLIGLGVEFDRREGELARGLEAAHSHARILHAGGDATGFTIEMALVEAVRAGEITVLEHTFVSDLVVDAGVVVGVRMVDEGGEERALAAEAVVLASGGAGQLFRYTTNPAVATGDGVAMACRAGAQLENVEFYQFHPTALAVPGTFLISEAVRGEGAVLLDWQGRRFMQAVHPAAELAPRDVVARGIAAQMAAQGDVPVVLDATALGAEFLRERFPTIDAACRRHGFDWGREPIPVTPAAHYWMGGVRTDLSARTSLPGLYAVGEAACTGVHGANRLASNSLLESLVFAWRCAEQIVAVDATNTGWPELPGALPERVEPVMGGVEATVPVSRSALQELMWKAAGISRQGPALREAIEVVGGWYAECATTEQRETGNLLTLARVMLAAALAREESRGAHFRSDFPETVAALARPVAFERAMAERLVATCS